MINAISSTGEVTTYCDSNGQGGGGMGITLGFVHRKTSKNAPVLTSCRCMGDWRYSLIYFLNLGRKVSGIL
jgi:hypothetical protein